MTTQTCATCRLWRSRDFNYGGCYRIGVDYEIAKRPWALGRLFAVHSTGAWDTCPLWEYDNGAMPRFGFVKTKGAVVAVEGP